MISILNEKTCVVVSLFLFFIFFIVVDFVIH